MIEQVKDGMTINATHVTPRGGLERIGVNTRRALAAYYGGELLADYIPKFSAQEDDDKHKWRQNTSIESYDNYPEEILQQYLEGISKAGGIKRDVKVPDLNKRLEDDYASWFEAELMPMALLLDEVYVRICLPQSDANIKTLRDKKDAKLFPYPVLWFPESVVNFSCDRHNRFEWICISLGDSRYEIYDKKNVYTCTFVNVEKGVSIDETQPHGFNAVPFVRVMWRENKSEAGLPKPGRAFLSNVINKSISGIRYVSMQAEIIHFHAYPKLVMDEITKKNIEKQGGMGPGQVIPEGVNPGGTGGEGATRYLTMPDTELRAIMEIVYERIPKAIYRAARLRDRSTDKVQSGISKVMDMAPEISVLSDICKYLSRVDRQIVEFLASVWTEKDNPDVTIDYPKTFDVKSTSEILNEVAILVKTIGDSSLPQSETAEAIIAARMYMSLLSDLDATKKAKIEKEIEEAVKKAAEEKENIPKENIPPVPPVPKKEDEVYA